MNRTIPRTIIVLATLVAIGLGGSVTLPAQTLLAAVAGLLLLLAPPRGQLPTVPLILGGLLLLLALAAFLPVDSSFVPWRHYLATQCHLPPPNDGPYAFPLTGVRTPQPWLTLQAAALLVVGLAWGLYLLSLPWERTDRIFATELLVFGVALLALLAALAFILHFRVPGWTQTENRGWFPNRNQTADVLALTGIAAYALIFDRLRKGKRTAYLLLLALVPIVLELVISYSRAGILLFFGGVLAWHLWPRPGQRRGASIKWLALSAALGIVLLSVFLTFGGETLARFLNPAPPGATTQDITDFRGSIQSDALRFSLQAPWLGTGLGNFEPLFSFSRIDSINGSRAIHPESDWLWLASEMGWPAVALVVAGLVWWLRRALPLDNKAGESMRRALIVAVLVFAVHGLVDVSGHRLGSLWVALLLAGMALPVQENARPSPVTSVLFRGLGGALLVIAVWWGGSLLGWNVPPTTVTLDRMQAELARGLPSPAAMKVATDAIRIAPLDWTLYLQRGRAETADRALFDAARRDFAIADTLNPFWVELPIDEGEAWLDANEPGLALDAWTDGLQRAGPLAREMYHDMVGLAPPHSILREGLAQLAFANVDDLLAILPSAEPEEAAALLGNLLQSDPRLDHLTVLQRQALFAAWWTQGDRAQLIALLHDHPEWDGETWLYQARFAAQQNDFPRAGALCAHWVKPPLVPPVGTTRGLDELAADFQSNPNSLPVGLTLFLAQMQAGQNDPALATLAKIRALPGDHPAYLFYLEAQINSARNDWPAAWSAWQNFLGP